MNESVKQLKERILMLEKENQMLKEELYKRGITFITNEKHFDYYGVRSPLNTEK